MIDVHSLLNGLQSHNNNTAYTCFLQLRDISCKTNAVYPYFDCFVDMMRSGNSYVRTRGLLLIAANARWDVDYKLDGIIDEYLSHIMDEKPTVSRQLIAALPDLARHKPELNADIRRALHRANPGKYRDTMAPLIERDIARALSEIKE